jgi:hypothetical protein
VGGAAAVLAVLTVLMVPAVPISPLAATALPPEAAAVTAPATQITASVARPGVRIDLLPLDLPRPCYEQAKANRIRQSYVAVPLAFQEFNGAGCPASLISGEFPRSDMRGIG